MQIGIDLGASKIEFVLLDKEGNEHHRERVDAPKDYKKTLSAIKDIVIQLEKKAGQDLPVGVCHPGIHSIQTGLVKNAPNSYWINEKPLQKDLRKTLSKEIYCENDANCFALSEAIDGSGKHYNIVFGLILGSGVGGGLVIDKKIVNGPNGITGEWGHNQLPSIGLKDVKIRKTNLRAGEIEQYVAGLGVTKGFKEEYNRNFDAQRIFELYRKHDIDAENFIDEYKERLSMSLATVINILDPDVFVFGGGVSNEIDFFDEIKKKMKKYVAGGEFEGVFLKPKFGDASGVRGAARLARTTNY